MNKRALLSAALWLLLVAARAAPAVTTCGVTVEDQAIANDAVTIARVSAAEPSWVDIHSDAGGQPGPIIGCAHVEAGETTDLAVKVEAGKATPTLYAMLHADRGRVGVWEFPGPDAPVEVQGVMVNPSFRVLAAAGGDPPATVSIRSYAFSPQSLTVDSGTTVTWVNQDTASHTVTADDGSFDSGNLEQGARFSRRFPMAGTYGYYCAYHGGKGGAGMAGKVIVQP